MAREQHEPLTMEEAEDFISRAAWKSAKSTEDMAPHQYVVQKRGERRDDFTEEEFWRMAELIKAKGRRELWTPPEEWVRRWGGKPMKNRYLYLGEYAYWSARAKTRRKSCSEASPTHSIGSRRARAARAARARPRREPRPPRPSATGSVESSASARARRAPRAS